MPRRVIDLGIATEDYDPRLVNKKQASQDKEQAERLLEAGYKFPEHWKRQTDRPFIGWDGEGITYPGNTVQSYVLFGASTGDRVTKPDLPTSVCLDLILSVEAQYPEAIHVGFAFQYDVNMILKDLDRRHLERLYRRNKVTWGGYRLEYRPGKWLNIRSGSTTARLFDVWGFFQSSFVVACERFLGKDDPELDRIREGKAARQSFTYEQLEPFIVPYWEGELRLLVRLMDSLRSDLHSAGLKVGSWHGPGAVANTVFRKHNVKAAKAEVPKEVNRAAQYAYAGGRFELFQAGSHKYTVWEYDINSAYPNAIAQLPNLQAGTWEFVRAYEPGTFGVWRIGYDARGSVRGSFTRPNPVFFRDRLGNVSFPPMVQGWAWSPEADLVPEAVIDGWVFRPDSDDKPFAFVPTMYAQRRQWKQEGNSAEKALKLALNSLYGKMAQRTGWQEEGDPLPVWHQLEWAGYVTSATRAMLWQAISLNPSSVIAVETDALFTTEPLPLDIGSELGQWEESRFDWITYLQSGLYFAGKDGVLLEKYRGFDKGSIPYERVLRWLETREGMLYGETTRFIGMGVALHTRAKWRSWQTDKRLIKFGGGGKRAHVKALCKACKAGASYAERLHTLAVITVGGRSEPHSLPWLEGAEGELRLQDQLAKW